MAKLDNAELRQLLYKEAQGNLSSEEQQKLDVWYSSYDTDLKDLQVFRSGRHENLVKRRLFKRIMEAGFPQKVILHNNYIGLKKLRRWSAVAAVFLGIIGTTLLWQYAIKGNAIFLSDSSALISFQSAQGTTEKLKLEDGTEIWLNANTTVSYPQHFGKQSREVFIEGEAFFEVAHDPSRPFTVHMGKISARVLGTSFNINAYPATDKVRISVATGKVGVSDGQKALDILTRDKRIVFDKSTGNYAIDDYPASFVNAWREGNIRLDGASFSELAVIIKNNYGYELKTDNQSLRRVSFNTTFHKNDKIEDVMNVISRIPDAEYHIRDNIIIMN